jgi:UDP-N-acetylmuramoyl-L-alanyl-D-glutamate--2,6-diaminopimelate ligase
LKRLEQILENVEVLDSKGSLESSIQKVEFDSRNVSEGDLFVAQRGVTVDGHQFIEKAIDLGAVAIICEEFPENIAEQVSYIKVDDASSALGLIASSYFDHPSAKLKLVGVTGTNGKTTIVTLLYDLLVLLGYKAGMLSTVLNRIGSLEVKATHTTPDAIQINRYLNEMVIEGCDFCFMEVSSHAIVQNRVAGLKFTGGVFTNLTHDHLDYHKTFKEYIYAKKKFFDDLNEPAFAITNSDDKNGKLMFQNTKASRKSYGLKSISDYKCRVLEKHLDGTLIHLKGHDVWVKFIGGFNIYNLLAVYSVTQELNLDSDEVMAKLSLLRPVNGRFDTLKSLDGVLAIVDYAHTPDALKNVLTTINEIRIGNEQLITVIGAGGDRDKSKRPEMAKIGAELSNLLILTSDNPRSEDPETIINDMQKGVGAEYTRKVLAITNRAEAIKAAVAFAKPGDFVLIAGKGHETYQEVNGVRTHFDDKEELKKQMYQIIQSN